MSSPSTLESKWYVLFQGVCAGPFSAQQLQGFADQGRLAPNDLVSSNSKEWQPASKLSEIVFASRPTEQPKSQDRGPLDEKALRVPLAKFLGAATCGAMAGWVLLLGIAHLWLSSREHLWTVEESLRISDPLEAIDAMSTPAAFTVIFHIIFFHGLERVGRTRLGARILKPNAQKIADICGSYRAPKVFLTALLGALGVPAGAVLGFCFGVLWIKLIAGGDLWIFTTPFSAISGAYLFPLYCVVVSRDGQPGSSVETTKRYAKCSICGRDLYAKFVDNGVCLDCRNKKRR